VTVLWWSKGDVTELSVCPEPEGDRRIERGALTRGSEEWDDEPGEVGSSFAIGFANSFSKKRE